MPNWIPLAKLSECPPGEGRELIAAGRIVALFNVDGEFHALDGICPHQGGPLGKGALTGCIVTCPWHGWQYDVRTGRHTTIASLEHPRFELKIEGDEILIRIDT